jgi:hypothetical protein
LNRHALLFRIQAGYARLHCRRSGAFGLDFHGSELIQTKVPAFRSKEPTKGYIEDLRQARAHRSQQRGPAMPYVTAYLTALLTFLLADMAWLGSMSGRFYRPVTGDMLLPKFSVMPAAATKPKLFMGGLGRRDNGEHE